MSRIAVIGSGVSGAVAARLLSTEHDVTVLEAGHYAGGHANTVDVAMDGRTHPVDTGFMVFNRRTYPNFCRLLETLGVESQPSDMSFSVRCSQTDLEYQGNSLNGLFAQRRNLLRPSFLRMIADILRFNRRALAAVDAGQLDQDLADGRTVGDFLGQCRVGRRFIDQYLAPMAAAIWSTRPEAVLDFPARFMIGFYANHGLLQLRDRPQWRTIVGGSRRYVRALLEPLGERLRLNCPVESVARTRSGVTVTTGGGQVEQFDEVVLATHADITLRLLLDASPKERQILESFPYQSNEAVLHTDTELMPRSRRAWASWNYHVPAGISRSASVTYDLSRLQRHDSSRPILLTLNETERIDPGQVLRTFTYHHPAYSVESIAAQRRLGVISGRRHTHYCGAYWGYGFHEDGVNSALAVASHFGIGLEACAAASTKESSGTAVSSL